MIEGEKVGGTYYQRGCTHTRDGETYVYRLCDDPFKDGIPVGALDREIKNWYTQLACIHRCADTFKPRGENLDFEG